MTHTTQEDWRERFDRQFGDEIVERLQEYNYTEGHFSPLAEAKDFVSDMRIFISNLLASQLQSILKEVENYPRRLAEIMPDGKLPFVFFEGKADENEKWSIYTQAFRDVQSIISNRMGIKI